MKKNIFIKDKYDKVLFKEVSKMDETEMREKYSKLGEKLDMYREKGFGQKLEMAIINQRSIVSYAFKSKFGKEIFE